MMFLHYNWDVCSWYVLSFTLFIHFGYANCAVLQHMHYLVFHALKIKKYILIHHVDSFFSILRQATAK